MKISVINFTYGTSKSKDYYGCPVITGHLDGVKVRSCNELVHLDTEFYDSNLVAHFTDCYINSVGYGVLNEDMDRFGVFYNYEVEDICYIDSWVVLDGSLKRVCPGDDLDEYELDFSSAGNDYPMLKCYKTK